MDGSRQYFAAKDSGAFGEKKSAPLLVTALRWLDQQPPLPMCSFGILLVIAIGIISSITGPHLSSSFLYLIPLLLVTRVGGFKVGAPTAVLAAGIWLMADLRAGMDFGQPVTPYWNAVMRLGTFLVAISLVSATKSLNSHLEERVRERTAELETKIAENRELEKSILEISDRERAAVGQDLHDGLCQQLVGAAFSANMLKEKLSGDPIDSRTEADRIADMIDDAITQARNLARGLYPVRLETEGLEMALFELCETLGRRLELPVQLQCDESLPQLSMGTGIHLYRITQEALMNAAKHAQASEVVVRITMADHHLLLQVEDDGVGIDSSPRRSSGMGLSIMEYRARMIGADFQISRLPTSGTRVQCLLPDPFRTLKDPLPCQSA